MKKLISITLSILILFTACVHAEITKESIQNALNAFKPINLTLSSINNNDLVPGNNVSTGGGTSNPQEQNLDISYISNDPSFVIEDYSLLVDTTDDSNLNIIVNKNNSNSIQQGTLCIAEYDNNNYFIGFNIYENIDNIIAINNINSQSYVKIFVFDNTDNLNIISDTALISFNTDLDTININVKTSNLKRESIVEHKYSNIDDFNFDNNYVRFSDDDIEYNFSENTKFLINGEELFCDQVEEFISENYSDFNVGNIMFTDRMNSGENIFDNCYDYITINFFKWAIVDSVSIEDNTYKIFFKNYDYRLKSTLNINKNNYNLSILKNNEEIPLTLIKENDVLLISYNFYSDYYYYPENAIKIIVSDKTVQKKITAVNDNESYLITSDNNKYTYADYMSCPILGETVILYLDAFDRICDYTIVNVNKYGIVYTTDNNKVFMINAQGNLVEYLVNDIKIYTELKDLSTKTIDQKCIIYELDETNAISSINVCNMNEATGTFDQKANRIMSCKISNDSTVIDVSKVSTKMILNDDLQDSNVYGSDDVIFSKERTYDVLYCDKNIYGSYDFIIIVGKSLDILESDKFYVVDSFTTDDKTKLSLYSPDSDTPIEYCISNQIEKEELELNHGDLITCTFDQNEICYLKSLFNTSKNTNNNAKISLDLAASFLSSIEPLSLYNGLFKSEINSWDTSEYSGITYGIITDVFDYGIEFSNVTGNIGETETLQSTSSFEYDYAENVNVYSYNTSTKSVVKSDKSQIKKSVYPNYICSENILDWNYSDNYNEYELKFAFARICDNIITDIFYIDSNKDLYSSNVLPTDFYNLELKDNLFSKDLIINENIPYLHDSNIFLAFYKDNKMVEIKKHNLQSQSDVTNIPDGITSMKAFIVDADNILTPLSHFAMNDDMNFHGTLITKIYSKENSTKITFSIDSIDDIYNNIIDIYEEDKLKSYFLDPYVTTIVNGYESYGITNSNFLSNKFGYISLYDHDNNGKYDEININCYSYASVDFVYKDTIYLNEVDSDLHQGYISLDTSKPYTYNITKNNIPISINDLKKNDILSIQFDMENGLNYSKTINIIACDNTVTGVVSKTEFKNDLIYYTIDDNSYTYVNDSDYNGFPALEIGSTYTLYLDCFGRIVNYSERELPKNCGVIDRVFRDPTLGKDKVRIINGDGTREIYTIANSRVLENASYIAYGSSYELDGTLSPLANRFITYIIDDENEIKSIESLNGNTLSLVTGEFSERYNKINSVKMCETTTVMNLSETVDVNGDIVTNKSYTDSDIYPATISSFKDGCEYTIYYGDKANDGTYRFVAIVYDNSNEIKISSGFSIVDTVSEGMNDLGNTLNVINMYTAESDELQSIFVSEEMSTYNNVSPYQLYRGDVISYVLDQQGRICTLKKIFSVNDLQAYNGISYNLANSFYKNYQSPNFITEYSGNTFFYRSGIESWDISNIGNYKGYARIGFGAVVDKTSSGISLAIINGDDNYYYSQSSDIREIEFGSNVNVYIYDFNEKLSSRIYMGSKGEIKKTYTYGNSVSQDSCGNTQYTWTNEDSPEYANYAFVKTFNGEITDIFFIIPNMD